MKKCLVTVLVIVVVLIVGCGTSTNESESSYTKLSVDYTTNKDGTYTCRGYNFKYKIEVSGIEGESQVTFVVLTNNTETRFQQYQPQPLPVEINGRGCGTFASFYVTYQETGQFIEISFSPEDSQSFCDYVMAFVRETNEE